METFVVADFDVDEFKQAMLDNPTQKQKSWAFRYCKEVCLRVIKTTLTVQCLYSAIQFLHFNSSCCIEEPKFVGVFSLSVGASKSNICTPAEVSYTFAESVT